MLPEVTYGTITSVTVPGIASTQSHDYSKDAADDLATAKAAFASGDKAKAQFYLDCAKVEMDLANHQQTSNS